MAETKLGFDTLKVRAGYNPGDHNQAVSVPIYQTASYELGDTERAKRLFAFSELGFVYSRMANPTVTVLEQRVAALDGAAGAVALGSGMAAVTYTLLNLAEGGGRILTSPQLYGGTFDSFKKIYPNFGLTIDYVPDINDPDAVRAAIRPDTRAVYVESISNPNNVVADIETLAGIAHENGLPLVVDNTLATPYLLKPIQYGADLVVYSATKNLGGHGNAIAGLILESGGFNWANGKFPQFVRPYYTLRDLNGQERSFTEVFPPIPFTFRIRRVYLAYLGAAVSPFDAYLILQGLETLSERVQKQVASTQKIIRYLENQQAVAWIKHPAAVNSPYKELTAKYLPHGAGSTFAFGVNGTDEQIDKFINSLQLFSYQVNLGDTRSLVVNSPKTTHGELTPAEQELAVIPANTVRLSIGLEDSDDLIADLEQAFTQAFI